MLEILTITRNTALIFDNAVNQALEEGWELVRRECFITGSDRATTFYAELERIIDELEEEEEEDSTADTVGVWLISREPRFPFKCSACGWKTQQALKNCPYCHRLMEVEE